MTPETNGEINGETSAKVSTSGDAFITGLNDFGNFYIWFGIIAAFVFLFRITVRELKYRKAIGMDSTQNGYFRPHLYTEDFWWYQADSTMSSPMNRLQWICKCLRLFFSGNKRQAPKGWEPYNAFWRGERLAVYEDKTKDKRSNPVD